MLHKEKLINITIGVIFVILVCASSVLSAEVTLQWNSVAEADGYKVYYGTASRSYQAPEDVGNQTTHTFTLDPGTYYFSVTAYNDYGESGYSEEAGPTTIAMTVKGLLVALSEDKVEWVVFLKDTSRCHYKLKNNDTVYNFFIDIKDYDTWENGTLMFFN